MDAATNETSGFCHNKTSSILATLLNIVTI